MEHNYQLIYNLIDNKRLNMVYKELLIIIRKLNNTTLKNEYDKLYKSYNTLIDDFVKKENENESKEIYNEIICKTYDLIDITYIEDSLISNTSQYFSLIKKKRINPGYTLEELQVQLETYSQIIDTFDMCDDEENTERSFILEAHDISINELFEKIVAGFKWNATEESQAYTLIRSDEIKNYDKAIMVSAVTISLLHSFDIKKYRFLLNSYINNCTEISQRAIVGIALVSLYNEKRIILYSKETTLLTSLKHTREFIEDLCNVQLLLLMTKETNKISKTISEEIMPKFFNNESEEYNKYDLLITNEKIIEKRVENEQYAINKMEELHNSGADICMNTFSTLKQDKFFNTLSHWFYPFFEDQKDISTISKEYKKNSPLFFMLKIGFLCNSDKYSFCLTLLKIPKKQRDIFIYDMNNKNELFESDIKAFRKDQDHFVIPYKVCELYIHDLYRYFKLWKYKDEINDIFNNSFELWKCLPLSDAINQFDTLQKVGTYFLKYEHIDKAIDIYKKLIIQQPSNSAILQKLGFAYQKKDLYNEAIDYYKKADIIVTDNPWIILHLAQCYYKKRDYNHALYYYRKIELLKPNNFGIIFQIGYCHSHLKQYKEALQHFFKILYIDEKSLQAKKAIAWCYFLSRNFIESINYYKIVIRENNANDMDFFNYAHALFANNEMQKAIKYYKKVFDNISKDMFIRLYNEDKHYLLDANIKEMDINIMLDIITNKA